MNDQHWLTQYHRTTSASYGKEAGWSETKGTTHLTATGKIVSLLALAAVALVALAVVYG